MEGFWAKLGKKIVGVEGTFLAIAIAFISAVLTMLTSTGLIKGAIAIFLLISSIGFILLLLAVLAFTATYREYKEYKKYSEVMPGLIEFSRDDQTIKIKDGGDAKITLNKTVKNRGDSSQKKDTSLYIQKNKDFTSGGVLCA